MSALKKFTATTKFECEVVMNMRGLWLPFFCAKKKAGPISGSPATASIPHAEFKLALLNISVSSFL